MVQDGSVDKMSKKEGLKFQREIAKLQRSLGGIKNLEGLSRCALVMTSATTRVPSPKHASWEFL